MITPLAPYIAWANAVFPDEDCRYEDMRNDEGEPVFLGPDFDTVEEAHAFVLKNFAFFFENYLEQWCTDESLWPRRRTRKMFKEWFAVRIHSIVEDVLNTPLERDPPVL